MEITLQLEYPINQSCQVGDIVYYIPANQNVGGFETHLDTAEMVELGTITQISNLDLDEDGDFDMVEMSVLIDATTTPPTPFDFLLFAKDRRVNETTVIGYYAKVRFQNNSRKKAELFTVTCEATGSSK